LGNETDVHVEVLGVDIGGSGIKGAMVDAETGKLLTERVRIKTPRPSTPKAVIGTISKLVKQFDYSGPLGVGFPAIITDGTVRTAANVHRKWIGYNGVRGITKTTGLPVTLLNDADAAGKAEMRFGAGQSCPGAVMILTLGTGIGTALFVDGKLWPNTELGHIYLRGMKTDAENYASDRARSDEKLSWKKWANRLDEYLLYLEMLFSPALFILGGGVSKSPQRFIPHLSVQTKVVPAQLRNEAGIIGAAYAAYEAATENNPFTSTS